MWDAVITVFINVLLYIYDFVGNNFGLAIIFFTLLIRLVTYPLNAKQMKSTQAMQDLQGSKEWQDIQKKYKNDKEKLAQEQMRIYQEMGVSPFGSCLPTIIQFPIIIALYQSITRSLAVTPLQLLALSKHITNGATLIPLNRQFLWMDLSQPERLIIFGFSIPLLAVIVAVTSYLQTKMMTPANPNANDQGAQMSKMMNLYMPLFMGWLAFSFPSGLAIYFITSNLASIIQYGAMGKLDWKNLIPKKKTA
ncbi:MAG TPA: protein translocase component YidC [Chloroflexi bacterium]|nr:protein translocase component YidC [Chloroflexota bacterium]HBY09212.1 protein translocase component YidC [Chloroflexota bacterium]